MASGVLHKMPPLEEMGLLCSTLFLESYTFLSIEEVMVMFEDWLNKECDISQLNFILNLLKEMCIHEKHFLEVSKLQLFSNHFTFDKLLVVPSAGLEFFEKLFHEDYYFNVKDIGFFLDSMTQVILFNNVSSSKISATCQFFELLLNNFLNCELLHKHAIDFAIFL